VPTPYKQQIHDQLWLLLEAHAPLVALVTAGKELKQTGDGWLRDRLLRGAGDFPQVAIDGGRFNLSGFTIGKTFADEEPSASLADVADMPIRRRCEFTITITGRGLKSTDVDPTEEETQVAILKGGPRLGLPAFVLEWGPIEAEFCKLWRYVRRKMERGEPIEVDQVFPTEKRFLQDKPTCPAKISESSSATRMAKSFRREPAS
jgi:hypothetical protein